MTAKALGKLHLFQDHGGHKHLLVECIRLKIITKKLAIRIRDANLNCVNQGNNFKTGKHKMEDGFNINILVRYSPVNNLKKFTSSPPKTSGQA